jgi:hypothetical protein
MPRPGLPARRVDRRRRRAERDRRAALGSVLYGALAEPQRLSRRALAGISSSLKGDRDEVTRTLALRALAALAYGRPDLVDARIVEPLLRVASRATTPPLASAAAETLQVLATSNAGPAAARGLAHLLRRRRLSPVAAPPLRAALRVYVRWRPELMSLKCALDIAETVRDGTARDALLQEVLEPIVLTRVTAVDRVAVHRLMTLFGNRPSRRYALAVFATRQGLPPSSKARLDSWLGRHFPLRRAAMKAIGHKRFTLLVVHNVADGQGDEIVRVAPLVQALLDGHPSLAVTLATRRLHLYDHARVRAVSIGDDAAIDRLLSSRFDGLIDFNARTVPGVSYQPALEERMRAYAEARPLRLLVRALTRRSHFAFEIARIGRRRFAEPGGGASIDVTDPYDESERLIVALGLPVRLGQDAPRAGSLFTGSPSPESRAVWDRIARRWSRPVALVNAFGGSHPLKGFSAGNAARLAAEIAGLIDEGYAVVLVPNGQAWGGMAAIGAAVRHLDRARRSHVIAAPDPADAAIADGLTERADVPRGDRVIRLFKYFASYADLVVTVEGWMMHLLYAMGRPFRLFMAAQSSYDWLPSGFGPDQRLVTSMSPCAGPDQGDLLAAGAQPPRPARPRKAMLLAAVRGLEIAGGPEFRQLLLRVGKSADSDLRAAALRALGGRASATDRRLFATALADPAAPVRAAAASALLRAGVDCTAELGCDYSAVLRAHVEIARQRWPEVTALGRAALPAIDAATRDDNPVIRREARWIAERDVLRQLPRGWALSLTGGEGRRRDRRASR